MSILDDISASPERMRNFQRERLSQEVTELISRLMDEQGVSRAELASRLGKSRAYVTKLLSGDGNMTLRTISDIFTALGRSMRVVDRALSVWTPCLLVVEKEKEEIPLLHPVAAGPVIQKGASLEPRPRRPRS